MLNLVNNTAEDQGSKDEEVYDNCTNVASVESGVTCSASSDYEGTYTCPRVSGNRVNFRIH